LFQIPKIWELAAQIRFLGIQSKWTSEVTSCLLTVSIPTPANTWAMLKDLVNAMTCPMLSSLCKIGFFQTIQEDEGGFRQVLCTASEHQTKFMEMRDFTVPSNPESLALSIEAVRSINRRIADPVLGTSDGVIATIIAFACHTVRDIRSSHAFETLTKPSYCSMMFGARLLISRV
jgi:hypothetical protein